MIKITNFGEIVRFDISRSFFGRTLYWTAAYLVDGMMIDTGCSHTADELVGIIDGQKVNLIINTHSHEDHIGGNAALQGSIPGVATHAHPDAIAYIKNPANIRPFQIYRRIVWGRPQRSSVQPIDNGSMIATHNYQFQVIFTPGHTADHICLYEPEREWIFTGDLYVGGKDRTLRSGCNIWQIIESLKKIASLPMKGMYPGSARVRNQPAELLNKKIDYLERTGERVIDLAMRGYEVPEIARELFGDPMWIEYITGGHLSRRNLVSSYLDNKSN